MSETETQPLWNALVATIFKACLKPTDAVTHKVCFFLREVAPGDHVAVFTGAVWHHGIYVGDDTVLHVAQGEPVSAIRVDKFMEYTDSHSKNEFCVVPYENDSSDLKTATVLYAISMIDTEQTHRDAFAYKCRTGDDRWGQENHKLQSNALDRTEKYPFLFCRGGLRAQTHCDSKIRSESAGKTKRVAGVALLNDC